MKFFTKLQRILNHYASGRNVLVFFIVTQLVYGTMLFFSIPKVMQYANRMKILDMLPTGYTAQYAQILLQTLGTTGRQVYLFQQLPLDMVYPGLFAISYALLLTFIFTKAFAKDNKIQLLSVVPLFAGLFDYLENVGIITMLTMYPKFAPWVAMVTNVFSLLKSTFTTITYVLLMIGVVMLIIKKSQHKK